MSDETNVKRFLSLSVEPDAEWHGGIFSVGELAGEAFADSPMAGSQMVLWVSCETRSVHGKPSVDDPPFKLLIDELLEFTESQAFGYRPARICLTDESLTKQLADQLAGSGTEVIWQAEPEFWCEVKSGMAGMAEHMFNAVAAPALADSDCTEAQIRAFAEAAASFYRARPWQYFNDADLLKIETPKPPKFLKHATVLGSGRQEFGIGFYESTGIHWDMRSSRLDMSSLEIFSLTFNGINEAFPQDVALWKELNLPLETGDAFPQFLFYSPEDPRPPHPKELEFVTTVLATLAATSEEDIDSGQWSKQVSVQNKNKRCKISIPDLLDPPDRKEWLDRGMVPERRGNERHFRLVQPVMAQNEGMGLDELNELLNSKFTGSMDDFDYPAATPFDRAESLCYAAIDTYGRRRIQLARQALQEDPTHVESSVLLAESIHEATQKIELFQKAVKLGESQNADLLETEAGNFWGISETRSLMRAKYGLANALAMDGQANEAIEQMLDMLTLNTDDNMGVRYEVIPLLLSQDREKEAIDVLNLYSEETASWLFLKTQVEFRRESPAGRSAQKAMSTALKFNRHVVEQLMAGDPPSCPEHYALGSPEEAATVIHEQLGSWIETEGFVDWMFLRYAHWERESSRRERERKRKALAKDKKRKKSRK